MDAEYHNTNGIKPENSLQKLNEIHKISYKLCATGEKENSRAR